MSQEYFETLEFLDATENSRSEEEAEEEQHEFIFTKEVQDLQSTLNKNRLLELYHKIKTLDNKEFIIYLAENNLRHEDDTSSEEIMFVYAKGLSINWEFPLFVFYKSIDDSTCYNFAGLLKLVLQLLHTVKLKPLACILGFHPSHIEMFYNLGITVFNPYFQIEERKIILCIDFFSSLKDTTIAAKVPLDILRYMEYFNRECESLDNWNEEFEKFKDLLTNVYSMETPMFPLYYSVAARLAALNAAKAISCWPVKMVCFRETKLQTFLYRVYLENVSKYDELLRILPDIYMEYY